jgi:hypothetical protein
MQFGTRFEFATQEGRMVSRRDFGKMALAGLPMCAAARAENAVRLGVSTYSYRDLVRTPGRDNIEEVIKALAFAGARENELHSANA